MLQLCQNFFLAMGALFLSLSTCPPKCLCTCLHALTHSSKYLHPSASTIIIHLWVPGTPAVKIRTHLKMKRSLLRGPRSPVGAHEAGTDENRCALCFLRGTFSYLLLLSLSNGLVHFTLTFKKPSENNTFSLIYFSWAQCPVLWMLCS